MLHFIQMVKLKNMNNNIQEDYVSFEIAKLLKEKGFKQTTLHYYFEDNEFKQNKLIETTGMDYGSKYSIEYEELLENWNDNFLTKKNGDRCFGCNKSNGYFETFSAPTHALAIKWIRKNFQFHIWYDCNQYGSKWKFYINRLEFGDYINSNDEDVSEYPFYDSPEEATEAALLYTLQNLIP